MTRLYQLFKASTGVSTDTRSIQKGNLFFALSGTNFNGNQFAAKALEAGASYAVIDDPQYANEKTLLVENCLQSLQALATEHRKKLNAPIISLTGSNGKTTTKELIAKVLSYKYKTIATQGNLNNHIGVPLSLLQLKADTEIAVIEMGANHQGEIAQLCKIAYPDYGYITNFGKAHLEGFGGLEGVIKGKSELYQHLISKNKKIFINQDDHKQVELTQNYHNRISFGSAPASDYSIHKTTKNNFAQIKIDNEVIQTQLLGLYNAQNAAAAAAIGKFFEVPLHHIKEALSSYQPSNNRSQITNHGSIKIIMDAYNANPTSMLAALEEVSQLKADQKTIILGDMFEVGPTWKEEHQTIVDTLKKQAYTNVFLCGKQFMQTDLPEHFIAVAETKELIPVLSKKDFSEQLIFIKGSRGMALEQLLPYLKEQ